MSYYKSEVFEKEIYSTIVSLLRYNLLGKAKWCKSAHGRVLGRSVDEEETRRSVADVLGGDDASAAAVEYSAWSLGYLAKEESS